MRVAESIELKLREALAPTRLDIIDESHKHAGHVGARPEGETHFRVEVASAAFEDKSRLDRQRLVYRILAVELEGPVHALSLKTMTPDEERRAD